MSLILIKVVWYMIISYKVPRANFGETGFYMRLFPSSIFYGKFTHWRYSGYHGLVYQPNISGERLPNPHVSWENGEQRSNNGNYSKRHYYSENMFQLPFYLIYQLGSSTAVFFRNLGNLYHLQSSPSNDLMEVPFALADFIPAIVVGIVSALIPLGTVLIISMNVSYSILKELKGATLTIGESMGSIIFGLVLLPFFAVGTAPMYVAQCLWGLLISSLMFTKAALATALSALTVAIIPLKGLISTGVWVANKISSLRAKNANDSVPEDVKVKHSLTSTLTALTKDGSPVLPEPVAPLQTAVYPASAVSSGTDNSSPSDANSYGATP